MASHSQTPSSSQSTQPTGPVQVAPASTAMIGHSQPSRGSQSVKPGSQTQLGPPPGSGVQLALGPHRTSENKQEPPAEQ